MKTHVKRLTGTTVAMVMLVAIMATFLAWPTYAQQSNTRATGYPTISGTADVGETLTADPSGFTDADGLENVNWQYQWHRVEGSGRYQLMTPISGATSQTYKLTRADGSKRVAVDVIFDDDQGNEERRRTNDVYPSIGSVGGFLGENTLATGNPIITGTPEVGQTLTMDTSGITDADGMTLATWEFYWHQKIGGVPQRIPDATSQTFTLTDEQEGVRVYVTAKFIDDNGYEEGRAGAWYPSDAIIAPDTTAPTLMSAEVDTSDPSWLLLTFSENLTSTTALLPPTSSFTVTVSGESQPVNYAYTDGDTLIIQMEPVNNSTPRIIYRGETVSVSYTDPTDDDDDDESAIQDLSGNDAASFSDYTVTNDSTSTSHPHMPTSLTATANGSTDVDLSWDAPARTGGEPITAYHVERSADDGATWGDIQANTGNTDTTYQDTGLNSATDYSYRVSAINSLGTSHASESTEVETGNNNRATGKPVITGTPEVGQTLTADTSGIMDADGMTNVVWEYQWYRQVGETATRIPDATSQTYTLTAAEAGGQVSVAPSFIDDGGSEEGRAGAWYPSDGTIAADITAPALESATVLENLVELTFDENIDTSEFQVTHATENGKPISLTWTAALNNAFTVTANGVEMDLFIVLKGPDQKSFMIRTPD